MLEGSATSNRMKFPLLNRNRDAQEGRGNGGGVLVRAFVLAVEQNFELLLQIAGFTVLFRSFECIHGRPVIFSEFTDEFRWLLGKVKDIGISDKRYILFWNPRGSKSLDHVALDPPRHRADEAFWR